MSGMIFRLYGGKELVERLRTMPARVQNALSVKLKVMASEFSEYVKQDKLSGQVLNTASGKLKSSIYARVYTSKSKVTMSTGSRGDVPYAAIHEYGGHTAAHAIFPSKARVLRYMRDGSTMYALSVMHPGSDIPERSYMRSALADKSEEIRAALSAATVEEAQKP